VSERVYKVTEGELRSFLREFAFQISADEMRSGRERYMSGCVTGEEFELLTAERIDKSLPDRRFRQVE